METLSVLIVDDEQRVLDEIEEFLSKKDYNVVTANRATDAYHILEKNVIDIIILDVKMPGVDGLEALQQIKTEYPNVEVIMISGHGDMDTVIEAMRKGAIDYFQKPFRLMDINNPFGS